MPAGSAAVQSWPRAPPRRGARTGPGRDQRRGPRPASTSYWRRARNGPTPA